MYFWMELMKTLIYAVIIVLVGYLYGVLNFEDWLWPWR